MITRFRRYNETVTYSHRVLRSFLADAEPYKPYVHYHEGHLWVGTASQHRTPTGVKYNRLVRLIRRVL